MPQLPPENVKRWTPQRKAAVLGAVRSGAISVEEACRRYEISGEELVTWLPNEEKFKTLIQQKRIIGEARSMSALVSDSPENLAKLFVSKDIEDAFEPFGKFRRVKR